jgi:hypothetical protein
MFYVWFILCLWSLPMLLIMNLEAAMHWSMVTHCWMLLIVERLYCKRPIQCQASSKIFTPPPPTLPGECVPPRLWCGGRTHSLSGEGGGGSIFWKTPDTALYSRYVSTLCFCSFRMDEISLPWFWGTGYCPPPPSLSVAKAGRNHLTEEIPPSSTLR